MNEEEVRAYQRGPVEFEKYIKNYQSDKEDVQDLQRQRLQVYESIEKKHYKSKLNPYTFPREHEDSSLYSSHPSLANAQYNLYQHTGPNMNHEVSFKKPNNSMRKIMNIQKIREILAKGKEKDQSLMTTATKKDTSQVNAPEQLKIKAEFTITTNPLIANSKEIQYEPKSIATLSNIQKSDRKLNVDLSIQKHRQMKRYKKEMSRSKSREINLWQTRGFKKTDLNEREQKKSKIEDEVNKINMAQHSQSFLFHCCEQKPQDSSFTEQQPIFRNLITEKREIKIVKSIFANKLHETEKLRTLQNEQIVNKTSQNSPMSQFQRK